MNIKHKDVVFCDNVIDLIIKLKLKAKHIEDACLFSKICYYMIPEIERYISILNVDEIKEVFERIKGTSVYYPQDEIDKIFDCNFINIADVLIILKDCIFTFSAKTGYLTR